jgi:DNA repair protein RadC
MKAQQQDPATYAAESDDAVIERALAILRARMGTGPVFSTPRTVRDYLTLQLQRDHEVFAVLFLDSQHRLIRLEEMFRGTLTQTSVYPREVLKRALTLNAGAVVLAHNHPSGLPEPSRADEYLTQTLKSTLNLIDVRVLDHIIIGGADSVSMAERGLL